MSKKSTKIFDFLLPATIIVFLTSLGIFGLLHYHLYHAEGWFELMEGSIKYQELWQQRRNLYLIFLFFSFFSTVLLSIATVIIRFRQQKKHQ